MVSHAGNNLSGGSLCKQPASLSRGSKNKGPVIPSPSSLVSIELPACPPRKCAPHLRKRDGGWNIRRQNSGCRSNGFLIRSGLTAGMAQPVHQFQPMALGLGLASDPPAEARHLRTQAASQEESLTLESAGKVVAEPMHHEEPAKHANRESQREAASASLAGGMIAAEGRPVAAAEANRESSGGAGLLRAWLRKFRM